MGLDRDMIVEAYVASYFGIDGGTEEERREARMAVRQMASCILGAIQEITAKSPDIATTTIDEVTGLISSITLTGVANGYNEMVVTLMDQMEDDSDTHKVNALSNLAMLFTYGMFLASFELRDAADLPGDLIIVIPD